MCSNSKYMYLIRYILGDNPLISAQEVTSALHGLLFATAFYGYLRVKWLSTSKMYKYMHVYMCIYDYNVSTWDSWECKFTHVHVHVVQF